jgi:NADH dehydrogenase [ubiquinone] 1 alpha subcomplex assembly factor 7
MVSDRHTLEERLAERIRRNGPITFADFQAAALYDPDGGFFATGGGAGRAGRDFVTSPEVGSLFGLLVAGALDAAWQRLGAPDPFVVVEVGAGRGRLAADVLRAAPACAPALRYVLVERSEALRSEQRKLVELEPPDEALGPVRSGADPDDPPEVVPGRGPLVTSLDELPSVTCDGVVFANELLDNLPVRVVERRGGGWWEVRVGLADERLVEALVPADAQLGADADDVAGAAEIPDGTRLPVPGAAAEWLATVSMFLRRGEVILIDYLVGVDELVARGSVGWLRTYRAHERGGDPLVAPGSQDLTCDVPREFVATAARRAGFRVAGDVDQATWLQTLGIDDAVEAGRVVWRERAHLGDLEAIAGRSRIGEAAALTDPAGLGAHRVMTLSREVR